MDVRSGSFGFPLFQERRQTSGMLPNPDMGTGIAGDGRIVNRARRSFESCAMKCPTVSGQLSDRSSLMDLVAYRASMIGAPCLHRDRNPVERFFNRIKHCRRVATRYEKLAANDLSFVKLASIRLWLRVNESTSWISSCRIQNDAAGPCRRRGGRAYVAASFVSPLRDRP